MNENWIIEALKDAIKRDIQFENLTAILCVYMEQAGLNSIRIAKEDVLRAIDRGIEISLEFDATGVTAHAQSMLKPADPEFVEQMKEMFR